MKAFVYGTALQWKMDLRSKSLLVTCYLVPLLFFAVVGEIFISVMPQTKETLIYSMTIMGICMGTAIGVPPSLAEIYGTDIRKMYKANGIPVYYGILSTAISSLLHLMILSMIINLPTPVSFDASRPENPAGYFGKVLIFAIVSLSTGAVLGCGIPDPSKIPMFSQIVFLPSIMLSGIMFPVDLLPEGLRTAGKLFPASWAYRWMTGTGSLFENLLPLCGISAAMAFACIWRLRTLK